MPALIDLRNLAALGFATKDFFILFHVQPRLDRGFAPSHTSKGTRHRSSHRARVFADRLEPRALFGAAAKVLCPQKFACSAGRNMIK